jgi:hypothetical protein
MMPVAAPISDGQKMQWNRRVSLATARASLRSSQSSTYPARRVGQIGQEQTELCPAADTDAITCQRCSNGRGAAAFKLGVPSAFGRGSDRRHATRIPADDSIGTKRATFATK